MRFQDRIPGAEPGVLAAWASAQMFRGASNLAAAEPLHPTGFCIILSQKGREQQEKPL